VRRKYGRQDVGKKNRAGCGLKASTDQETPGHTRHTTCTKKGGSHCRLSEASPRLGRKSNGSETGV